MIEILFGSLVFVAIILTLTVIVMAVRTLLLPSRPVKITMPDREQIQALTGDTLLNILTRNDVPIPAACGGAGTCGQCRVTVTAGGGEVLATEAARLTRRDIGDGLRLACQIVVRGDLTVQMPFDGFSAKEWACTIVSNRTVAPLIRELVLSLPDAEELVFRPGAFVQVTAPPHQLRFSDFEISPRHQATWDRLNLSRLTSHSSEAVSRAYSLANTPGTGQRSLVLLVRLALPPPTPADAPPGIVSSFLFGLHPGEKVLVSGPFGDFGARDSGKEMIFIGGGVGMAPLRAIIHDQLERLESTRRISFWYGARTRVDLFYENEFNQLEAKHSNFSWTTALSDPAPGDDWNGPEGFVHDVVYKNYLEHHPAPQDCEYYLCGPPLMVEAVLAMLDDAGVDPGDIFNDAFGS